MEIRDAEGLAVYWTKAQPSVSAYIAAMVPDFHQSEDVLHQVAVVLVSKFADYDRAQPFEAWAIGIARLEILKHRRKYATEKHVFDNRLLELIGEEFVALNDEFEGRRRAFSYCLKKLTGRFSDVLQFRYFEGLSSASIAERMKLSSGAARALLHRARHSLRKCIEEQLFEQGGRS